MQLKSLALLTIVLPVVCGANVRAQDELDFENEGDRLATAIDSGSVASVRRLLDEGMSPNTLVYDSPPLLWAIWDERFYVVKLLLERGADVNLPDEEGYTSLMAACSMSNPRIAKLLLDNGADINAVELTYGMNALQSACEAGDEKIVDLLLKHGANLNHVDKYGGNCLEEAAFYGYGSIVEKLRGKGLTSDWPLHVACGLGDVERVKKLLAEGAKVDEPNNGWKNTPLHFAAGGGHVDVAKVLVEQGAKLDATNVLGAQPLHVCAGADTLEFAKWLVAEGVDMNVPDYDGNTPLDWAAEQVYDFLEAQGAEFGVVEYDIEEE